MLVLSRKQNEQIVIGDNIVVKVVDIRGGRIRLGIDAPPEVSIRREELAVEAEPSQQVAPLAAPALPYLLDLPPMTPTSG